MTAAQPRNPVTEGVHSLEVRWIFPGQLRTAVVGWFGRFPAEAQSRDDAYLLYPHSRGISVKLRAGGTLDVKLYRGSPGTLDLEGQARGRLESWQKWAFPLDHRSQDSFNPGGWRLVNKKRLISRFSQASGPILARDPEPGKEPGCAVELTEIRTRGETWWSLAFEATGPAGLLRGELEAAAALVFAETLPGGVEPGADSCRSYAEWLSQSPPSPLGG